MPDVLQLLLQTLAVPLGNLGLVYVLHGLLRAAHVLPKGLLGDQLPPREVIKLPVLLRLLQHLVDLALGEPALLVRDVDLALVVRLHVLRADLQYAVGVDSEGHLDLGHPT
mmetsp:Transcript_3753/g.4692  ORF Transcript_3753/g.4692 Transcript_3753/m.4692 type:complete len:111 (-) Transcript_3753:135-467(-)